MIVDYASEKCDSEQILLWSWIIFDSLMTGAQAKSRISMILRILQTLIPFHIFPKCYLGALFLTISKSAHYPKIIFSFIIWVENMDSPLIITVWIFWRKNIQNCEFYCQWSEMSMKFYYFLTFENFIFSQYACWAVLCQLFSAFSFFQKK